MKLVGARFRDQDDLQRVPAVLGAEVGGLYPKLFDRLQVGKGHAGFGAGIVGIHAVDRELGGVAMLSQTLDLPALHIRLGDAQIPHPWRKGYQRDRVAGVERKLADLLRLDRCFHR